MNQPTPGSCGTAAFRHRRAVAVTVRAALAPSRGRAVTVHNGPVHDARPGSPGLRIRITGRLPVAASKRRRRIAESRRVDPNPLERAAGAGTDLRPRGGPARARMSDSTSVKRYGLGLCRGDHFNIANFESHTTVFASRGGPDIKKRALIESVYSTKRCQFTISERRFSCFAAPHYRAHSHRKSVLGGTIQRILFESD